MATDLPASAALACTLAAIPAAARAGHRARTRRLFGPGGLERRPCADGYAFRVPAEAVDDVWLFVANERLCCPFLTFEIRIDPAPAAAAMQITGPPGSRELLKAELFTRGG